jgi:hypothetical protein
MATLFLASSIFAASANAAEGVKAAGESDQLQEVVVVATRRLRESDDRSVVAGF